MSSLTYRLKCRFEMTKKAYLNDSKFSNKLAIYRMLDDLSWRAGLKSLSEIYHQKKDEVILDYLKENLTQIIKTYLNDNEEGKYEENAPIWVCWWSGEENAPDLVKQCIKSIRKHAGKHPVYLVSQDNYEQFLTIPVYILKKVNCGEICLAHFADYIRISLIEKYGGLWLDSTIYCADNIPEYVFDNSLFTCKGVVRKSRFISNYRWTTFCLAGWKNNVFYRLMKQMMEEYWKKQEVAIDYLLFDYLIDVAYSYLPSIKDAFDKICDNNLHRDDLQAAMNMAKPGEEFEEIVNNDTVFYKLSWRETYSLKTKESGESIYQYFLKMQIGEEEGNIYRTSI